MFKVFDQAEIHRLAQSEDVEERKRALNELRQNFIILADKIQATNDLLALTKDQKSDVRWRAAKALGSAFSNVSDKTRAWNDLLALTKDKDSTTVRWCAVAALGSAFSHVSDKTRAWNDLLALTKDRKSDMQSSAAKALVSAFSHVSDKIQASNDLLALTKDQNSDVRWRAAKTLVSAFSHVSDKTQAWNDLLALTKDKDSTTVRWCAAEALGSAFSYVSDKNQAWNDLLALTKDEDSTVRWRAAEVLISAFSHLSYKTRAWNALLALTKDQNRNAQWCAVEVLVSAFPYVTDKNQAWNDLLALLKDRYTNLRWRAIEALGSAYPHVTYKIQALNVLLALTKDQDSAVRWRAAEALGSAYSHVTDKTQALNALLALTKDQDSNVRAYAYHSLGKVHVIKATEADEESFGNELEKALEWFEKSSQERIYYNPASFCLPFYRSFYSITCKKGEAEAEIQYYLAEAKSAVGGSESKEQLITAVENLSNALKEAHKAPDFQDRKRCLIACRMYCDRAADHLKAMEDKAPGAVRLLRKGLPIIDTRIKQILAEIQQRATTACKQSKGTPTEELACKINQEVQNWQISDQEQMKRNVNHLIFSLKAKIPNNPINKDVYDKIEGINKEKDLVRQYELLPILIALIPQIAIGGNMTGDIYNNVHIEGNGNVVGSNNIISINQQQLAKIPDEYARSLQAFSEAVNAQLKKYNISQEKTVPVQESINELVKEVEGVKPEEKIDIEKKEDIKDKIKRVAIRLLKILPEGAETAATFTPLAPFSKIIGKGAEEIVKEFQKQI